jgi:hypothetical protein
MLRSDPSNRPFAADAKFGDDRPQSLRTEPSIAATSPTSAFVLEEKTFVSGRFGQGNAQSLEILEQNKRDHEADQGQCRDERDLTAKH